MDEARLKLIEARRKSAAPGPYRRGVGNESRKIYDGNQCLITADCAQKTGTFFADAWIDILLLTDEVRRLQAELNRRSVDLT